MFDFAEAHLLEIPFVVVDTETTGLKAVFGDRVVEVGAVRFENGKMVGEFNALINPTRSIPIEASEIHGIYDESVADKPTFAGILPALKSILDGALLVAHNAPFDADFLALEYAIAHMPRWFSDEECRHSAIIPNPWLCTLSLARNHFYFGRNHLAHVARQLGVRPRLAHRALSDVYTTADILLRMAQHLEKQNLTTVGDLLYAQGGMMFAPNLPHIALPPSLFEAISQQTTLTIHYESKKGGTLRTILPKYVTMDNGIMYIIAFCQLRQEQRTFRLDRMRFI